MIIYQIIHVDSGNKYIGQTTRPPIKRWREHLYSLRNDNHPNRYLQYAWNKYGEESFKFEIIIKCDSIEELNNKEIELIENDKNLYNLGEGGNSFKHSEKSKSAIGNANKIPIVGMNIKTGEIKHYDSAADTEKDGFNEKCVRKCVLGFISKRKDGTTFRSISHKGWVWVSKDNFVEKDLLEKCEVAKRGKIRKERGVIGINIFTKKILQFKSSSEASRNGFRNTCIHRACNKYSLHKGFVWVFADSEDPQSLLENKIDIILSKNRTGPKSWQ